MRRWIDELLVAFQFLTRLPAPGRPYQPGSLSRAAKFFPLVSLFVGVAASLLQRILAPHLNRALVAAIGSRPRLYRLGPGGKGSRWHSPVVLRWPEIAALGASGALARGLAALMHPSKRQR